MPVKPPIGSTIRHGANPPAFWLPMLGRERTFASDAGDVAEASGSIPAGERHGGATWQDAVDGPCLAFDGSTGYVRCDGFRAPAGSPLTISYWQYLAGPPAGANSAFNLGQADTGGGDRCQCHSPYADSTIYWDYRDAGSGRLTASYAGHYGRWTHLALQVDPVAGYQAIYLDARLAASRASTASPMGAIAGAYVGAWNLASSYFEGKLSRFKVDLRILDPAEIARDFADPEWRLRRGARPARYRRRAYRPRPRKTQLHIGGHGLR